MFENRGFTAKLRFGVGPHAFRLVVAVIPIPEQGALGTLPQTGDQREWPNDCNMLLLLSLLIRLALPACKTEKRQLNDMKSMKHMKSLAAEKEIIPANSIDSRNHRWIYSFWGQRRTSCRKVRNDNLQRVIPCLLGGWRFWPIEASNAADAFQTYDR
jgi:hypothetical protein